MNRFPEADTRVKLVVDYEIPPREPEIQFIPGISQEEFDEYVEEQYMLARLQPRRVISAGTIGVVVAGSPTALTHLLKDCEVEIYRGPIPEILLLPIYILEKIE